MKKLSEIVCAALNAGPFLIAVGLSFIAHAHALHTLAANEEMFIRWQIQSERATQERADAQEAWDQAFEAAEENVLYRLKYGALEDDNQEQPEVIRAPRRPGPNERII